MTEKVSKHVSALCFIIKNLTQIKVENHVIKKSANFSNSVFIANILSTIFIFQLKQQYKEKSKTIKMY